MLPNVEIIKNGPKLAEKAEIYALLPDLAWDKTISAKIINKRNPANALPPIMCVIELDMVRA